MGPQSEDLVKVQNLKPNEAYNRIKDYYTAFIGKWIQKTPLEKSQYIFGNGRRCSIEFVDNSLAYINTLSNSPTLDETIALAKNVIFRNLEFSYHDEDNYGIKMGAYAHYIINTYNKGKL